jgi:hypothetical protein
MSSTLREDFNDYLNRLDISAIESAQDKLDECRYFIELANVERDRKRFRWLLSAFLSAAYSFFEMAALEARYRFCNEDGDPYPDEQALSVLANYVKVEKFGKNGVKAVGLSPLAKKLFAIRKGNTHHFPLSIMVSGSNLPIDFRLGKLRGEGVPALGFAQEVLELLEEVQRELDA